MAVIVQPHAGFMVLNVKNRRPKQFRHMEIQRNPYTDEEKRMRYRFGQESMDFIVDLLRDYLERSTARNHALSVQSQVMIALRFYASGNFLQVIGDTFGVDKATVSRVVVDVTNALVQLKDRFIEWPSTADQKDRARKGFHEIGGFPNVLGCIDGTHIRIQAPTIDEPAYVNRKGYHSINVQAVCDHEGKITSVSANWPGSAHDSHVFRTSLLCDHLETNFNTIADGFILGDSGYPCREFLLTPYINPVGRAQERFNGSLCATRVTIERTFGRIKRRFHALHSELKMRPERVCRIVIACMVLHNIAILRYEPVIDDDALSGDDKPGLARQGNIRPLAAVGNVFY